MEREMRFSSVLLGLVDFFTITGPALVSPAVADDAATCARASGDAAIAACTRAIGLDPKVVSLVINRGIAYRAMGDFDRAIADFNKAESDYCRQGRCSLYGQMQVYRGRGVANLYAGALANAVADFNQAIALDPKNAYPALWLDIANKRSSLPSRLANAVAQIDMTRWPAPIIRLYLGQMTPDAVLAAADNPNADTKSGQICEASFYTGELDLQQGKKEDATRLFRLAAATCPKSFVEYEGAKTELKTLDAAP
jgi:lipoprotein NlpI